MKKLLDILLSRLLFIIAGFLIQLILLVLLINWFSEYFIYYYSISFVLTILSILYIVDSSINPSYKIVWLICISAIPFLGALFYFLFNGNRISKIKNNKRLFKIYDNEKEALDVRSNVLSEIRNIDACAANQMGYIKNYNHYPIYKNTYSQYYPIGELMYESLLKELKKAEKFIFMEYFIIEEGKMWNGILDILKLKASKGVEVRIIFDDLGCFFTLPKNYKKTLESFGIKCVEFNKINPIFSILYNNRDHRKITVIDGKTAFTGGINLADEYINHIERFGHWKDSAVMLKGEAVWSFTVMFLTMWDFITSSLSDYQSFKTECSEKSDGYCAPFGDNPLNGEASSENIYLNMISAAVDYVYITTPYLILDSEMTSALCNAAKRGVDVKILTPHIPDKKAVFDVTRANYIPLLKNKVKIYEYTPGFVHAKSIVCDDKFAIVGTMNLDFRSLYLHFECGTMFCFSSIIKSIKEDFLKTIKKSEKINSNSNKIGSPLKKVYRSVLKIFSPLM